jgi:uncharacterized protein YkwD
MKNVLLIILVICSAVKTYSQVKKAPAKKPVVTAKAKMPVKTSSSPVAKAKPPVKASTTAKSKITTASKVVNKSTVQTMPNNPVNNADITNVTLTSREQEMINEINNLRSNPARYCTYVEAYLQKNDVDNDVKVAAKELINVLKKMQPLNPLTINPVMYNDAKQYGLSMAKRNVFEHSSLPYAENLSLGYKDIRDAIVDLLIDDGIPDRGHRRNLLSEKIKNVAVYELPGKVQDIAYCYVQEFK